MQIGRTIFFRRSECVSRIWKRVSFCHMHTDVYACAQFVQEPQGLCADTLDFASS